MIRGVTKALKPKPTKGSIQADIHNRFDIEVRDSVSGDLKQKAQAFNVICKGLWDHMGEYLSTPYFQYIVYGTGTGVPNSSDADLFSRLSYATANEVSGGTDIESGVSYWTKSITLSEGSHVGATITELGILRRTNGVDYLCSHAMLQDMNGNQIAITKTDTDIITIYATVYVHWKPSGYNGVYLMPPLFGSFRNILDMLLGGGYDYAVGDYGSYDYLVPQVSVGTHSSYSWFRPDESSVNITIDGANRRLNCSLGRSPVTNGNSKGGFRFVSNFYNYSNKSTKNQPAISIIDVAGEYPIEGESIGTGDGVTTEFSTKFDLPYNASVYVDGILQSSGVTVTSHPLQTAANVYWIRIREKLHEGRYCPVAGDIWLPGGSSEIYAYFYNPLHDLGMASWSYGSDTKPRMSFSDDFVNWSNEYSAGTVPEQYQKSKYIRVRNSSTNSSTSYYVYVPNISATFPANISPKNIIFDAPPAAGSVITIDYNTPFVPKDENHVYDLSFQIQLGEHTG